MPKISKKEIEKDLDTYKSLAVLQNLDGGKILISTLYKQIKNDVDTLANSYKTATHAEITALCASLKAHLDVLRVIKNAKTNVELAEEALKHTDEE